MYTLMKPFQVRATLLDKGVRTFTPYDFERLFRVTPAQTKHFLETQTTTGLLTRLKQGIYALQTDLPSEPEIANSLYKPSYISFEYALAYWRILPEMPYSVTSATTKPTRLFTANDTSFAYYTIKTAAYTGYTLVKSDQYLTHHGLNQRDGTRSYGTAPDAARPGSFLIAEPEKALVDYLYFVSLGKRQGNDRLVIDKAALDKNKLQKYAELYQRKKLTEKLLPEYL